MHAKRLTLLIAFCSPTITWSLVAAQELIAPVEAPPSQLGGHEYRPPPPIPQVDDSPYAPTTAPQPVEPITYLLNDVLQLASENNPTLRQARLHISAELAKALQAGLYPNPILSYEAEQIFVDNPAGRNSPGEFQGAQIQQRFVTAGKLQLSREKYLRRAQVSEHLAMAQQFRVCNDVRIKFYRTLAAAESLNIRRELLKTAEDAAVTAQESYNVGQANRPAVRRANVALERARLAVLTAENDYQDEFRQLTAVIGVPLADGWLQGELPPRTEPISFDAALSQLLAESPEMGAARAKLAVDQATVQRESVEWVPDVVVRGGTGYNFEAAQTTAVAGVSIEVPLFDRNQGTIRQARADYARQQSEIQRVELELRNRLASTYQHYATALQHSAEYERVILPETRAAYAELLASYQEDRVDWPDVLDSQHEYFDARLTQVDNQLNVRTHEVLIHGYLLHDGLMAAPGIVPPGHIDAVPKPR